MKIVMALALAAVIGALLMADMAHVAGLIAGGVAKNPLKYGFHVMTTTTHKTLRGPRGGMILSNVPELVVGKTAQGKDQTLEMALNSSIFPGIQGGPLMHVIAAKAVAFGEALRPDFVTYQKQVITNAKANEGFIF